MKNNDNWGLRYALWALGISALVNIAAAVAVIILRG